MLRFFVYVLVALVGLAGLVIPMPPFASALGCFVISMAIAIWSAIAASRDDDGGGPWNGVGILAALGALVSLFGLTNALAS